MAKKHNENKYDTKWKGPFEIIQISKLENCVTIKKEGFKIKTNIKMIRPV